ncbi:MAG: CotH kinase family protein [Myxococcota bacterium]
MNGVSKGLYGVIENYDEVFLRDYFSSTEALYEADGNLPSSLGGFSIDEGDSTAALDDLSDRVAAAMTGNVAATRALTTIDWRELTTLFGVEDLLQHTDGMKSGCHNFYMHVDTAGFWDFMAWSVDLALIPQYGSPGPIGSCMPLANWCDADVQCRALVRARATRRRSGCCATTCARRPWPPPRATSNMPIRPTSRGAATSSGPTSTSISPSTPGTSSTCSSSARAPSAAPPRPSRASSTPMIRPAAASPAATAPASPLESDKC